MESYRTVKQETNAEFIEKRSKFIGYIKPVQTEEEAIAFIQSIKSKHWDATHNVYAYSLREGQTRRYSDDGEPQGTAGIPTLDVLQKADITDAVVGYPLLWRNSAGRRRTGTRLFPCGFLGC